MIVSLFILLPNGEVLIEKHNRSVLPRMVLDPLQEALVKAGDNYRDVPPVHADGRHFVISVVREGLVFAAAVNGEEPPLFVTEFLHRMVDVFEEYFDKKVSEKMLRKQAVLIYQLLEEMLDNGFPLTTEPNVLQAMIMKPTLVNKIVKTVARRKSVQETLPTGQLSSTHWRRAGVKYNSNECFIDIFEEVDAIIAKTGSPIVAEVRGKIMCRCFLSDVPDLTLSFLNARLMDDVSLHPCVRLTQWSSQNLMSFVPPDGKFELASYMAFNIQNLPIGVRSSINYATVGVGKIELDVNVKHGQTVEDLVLRVVFPKAVNSVQVNPNCGSWTYEELTKTLRWTIKKMPDMGPATLRGSVSLGVGERKPDGSPPVLVNFQMHGATASGLKVQRLDVHNVAYKPFKGVKYLMEGGDYQVRS